MFEPSPESDRIAVRYTTTCANVVSSSSIHGEVNSIQHYVIKFLKALRQVVGFLRVLRFPPAINLTATI